MHGLTFRIDDWYLKWNPRSTGIDLGRERVRLGWISARHPAPRVVEYGSDGDAQWRGGSVKHLVIRRSVRLAWVATAVFALAACGSAPPASTSSESAISFTRGPVPEAARLPDGSIDLSQVPDFIPADGDNGIVGWVWSEDVLPPLGEERAEVVTVYADDLTTVIGRMYPNVGFVPLGAEAELLPDPQRYRELTIRVRNLSDQPAILEITEARDESEGPPHLIAPPTVVAAGAEEDVVFFAPRDRWSLNLRGDEGFFYSDDLGRRSGVPGFALVVANDGTLRMSDGG